MKAILLVIMALVPRLASANVFITTDTTISTVYSGTTVIGYSSLQNLGNMTNPTSPTVQLVAGGEVGIADLENSSVLNINGGTATGTVNARNNSVATMTSGSVTGFDILGESSLSVTGGTVGGITSGSGKTIMVTGGTIGSLDIDTGASIDFLGGMLVNGTPTAPYAEVGGTALISFYGTGFTFTTSPGAGASTIYAVSGTLEDGSVLNGLTFEAGSRSNLDFITTPEPVFQVVLGTGLAVLFGFRRWARIPARN